jgi:hypothetical protein
MNEFVDEFVINRLPLGQQYTEKNVFEFTMLTLALRELSVGGCKLSGHDKA